MEISKEEREWFRLLSGKRASLAEQLKDPAAAGFWNSVVDKYSDEAHFLYELLQNSDDAQATEVHIHLHKESLEYIHNGSVRFTLTDPNREDDKGTIGHLNALTSIGASNKQSGNSIGKFGIGFKSIFRYTDRPHIEDDTLSFDIQDYIVPVTAPRTKEGRKAGETYFQFPLKDAERDYQDILQKLRTLHHPLFFLSHLKKIVWDTDNGVHGVYQLSTEGETKIGSITYAFLTMTQNDGENRQTKHFHRYTDGCAIAFESNALRAPQPLEQEENIYCFFPTKESCPLPFVIHAPFLLTDNRESIKNHEAWNIQQVQALGELAGKALRHLAQSNLLKDTLFDIIPLEKNIFIKKAGPHFLAPIYTSIIQTLRTQTLFFTDNGEYVDATRTRHTEDRLLRDLFSGAQEEILPDGSQREWCFKELYRREEPQRSIIHNYLKENQLVANIVSIEDILGAITAFDIERQSMEWLKKFYQCLAKNRVCLKEEPVILCADGKARALGLVCGGNAPSQAFAGETDSSQSVHPALWEDEKCRRSLSSLGIKEPGPQAEVEQQILPLYREGRTHLLGEAEVLHHLRRITDCYQSLSAQGGERERFVSHLREIPFLPTVDQAGNRCFSRAHQTVLRTSLLNDYWEGCTDIYFLENQTIADAILPENRSTFYEFLLQLGVQTHLTIRDVARTPLEAGRLGLDLNPVSLRQYDKGAQEITDKEICGWDHFIQHLSPKRSAAFFRLLSEEIQRTTSFLFAQSLMGDYSYVEKGKQTRTQQRIAHTTARKVISEAKWVYDKAGEARTPGEIGETSQLSPLYSIASNDIFFFLGIKISDDLKGLSKEQKESIDIVNKFKECGFTIRDMEKLLEDIKAGKERQ